KLNILCDELHKEFGISVQSVVNIGNVSREILKICQEENCGMIIMGTQGYSAIEMLFIGSNTIKVLGDSDVPVMSVRKPANKHGYKNIILPIDESSHSRQKVGIAIEIAKEFGARLHILGFSEGEDTGFHDKLVNIYSQIDKLASQNNVTTVHETVVNPENNVNTTLEYTSNVNGDLIIIMSDQNKELSGLLLGPYSSQLINSAEVPVLTLNPVEQG
ncbi:MAG: universal stress protein, partial [Bacteroidota bacterium]